MSDKIVLDEETLRSRVITRCEVYLSQPKRVFWIVCLLLAMPKHGHKVELTRDC